MSKHTPGPWIWDAEKAAMVAPEVAPLGVKTGALIFCLRTGPSPADGRLMAAAPEMLAELKRINKSFGWQSVADLIAKAEGTVEPNGNGTAG